MALARLGRQAPVGLCGFPPWPISGRPPRRPRQHQVAIIVEAAVELSSRPVIDQQQPVGDQAKQMPVMADHHHRAAEAGERLDQRVARIDVEMVGRLVENENMRRVPGDQRERQPRPLAA